MTVSRDEDVSAHRGQCAYGLRADAFRNCHLVQHHWRDGSGRGVRDFVNVLASDGDFYDHYFVSRRQPGLRRVVVIDVAQFADRQ